MADFIDFNPRESLKKNSIAVKVAMENVQPFTKRVETLERATFTGGSKFRNGDTIMARITPCLENGKTAFVDFLEDGEVAFGSTEFIVLRAKESISDPQYIYYLAMSPDVRNVAIKSMVGSSGRQRVQQSVLNEYVVPLPNIDQQRLIGRFLADLDDKIALNQKINRNLAAQAQAIFKSWFVDFEPWGGVKPKEWREVKFGELVTINTRTFNPSKEPLTILEHYSIPAYDEKGFPVFESSAGIKSNKYIVDKSCFLISKLNPTTKRVWKPFCITQNSVCSTEFIVFRAKLQEMAEYLYSVVDSEEFSEQMCSHVKGSTGSRQRTTPADTLLFKVHLPSQEHIENFTRIVKPIYEQIQNITIESQCLTILRDNLLPKLMSGEIDVSKLDI